MDAIALAIVQESDGQRPDYLDTLACAQAAVGDFQSAVKAAEQALALISTRQLPEEVLATYREHRDLFAAGRAVGEG